MFKFGKKQVLGLALGSGGAKGVAHLGAIKALDEEGIEFGVYAGTSIGSLVGALLSKGYKWDDVYSIMSEMWRSKAYALLAVLDGGLVGIIRSVTGGADFSDLRYPFCAVATDLDSGKETVFLKGDLSVAIASSCAIPPTFKPINYGDKRLIDGAFVNYVPANRCVELGATTVISINLGAERKTNAIGKRALDDIYPENKVPLKDRSESAYKYSSVVIEPDLSAYTGFSVNKLEEMFEIGYNATKEKMDEIKSVLKGKARFSKKDAELLKSDGAIRIV